MSSSAPISFDERQRIWLETASAWSETEVESRRMGRAALALAIAQGVSDLDALVRRGETRILHAQLERLPSPAESRYQESDNIPLPLTPDGEWTEATHRLHPREAMAAWLIAQGADPWWKDAQGLDALDWAVRRGARSVVAQLLAHPQAPAPAVLRARMDNELGRQLPWLHQAVAQNLLGLYEDLVAAGWDPQSQDKNGFLPMHWISQEKAFQHFEAPMIQLAMADREAMFRFWNERRLKKLFPNHSDGAITKTFEAQLRETTAHEPTEEEKRETQYQQAATHWLSASPTQKSYKYTGVPITESNRESLLALFQEAKAWRMTVKQGHARGEWSLPMAAVWGCYRGERDNQALRRMLGMVEHHLASQSEAEADAWLDAPIREGWTPRAWLHGLVHGQASDGIWDTTKAYSDPDWAACKRLADRCLHRHGVALGDPRALLWTYAQQVRPVLQKAGAGHQWARLLDQGESWLWNGLLPPSDQPNHMAWNAFAVLLRDPTRKVRINQVKTLIQQTQHWLRQAQWPETPNVDERFEVLWRLASLDEQRIYTPSGNSDPYVRLNQKVQAFAALVAFTEHPSGRWLLPVEMPFPWASGETAELKRRIEKSGPLPGVPVQTREAWQAWLAAQHLANQLEAVEAAPVSTRRPRL